MAWSVSACCFSKLGRCYAVCTEWWCSEFSLAAVGDKEKSFGLSPDGSVVTIKNKVLQILMG